MTNASCIIKSSAMTAKTNAGKLAQDLRGVLRRHGAQAVSHGPPEVAQGAHYSLAKFGQLGLGVASRSAAFWKLTTWNCGGW
jgi:hypothetical protein